LQVYGRHKLAAERAVLESGLRARVVRTSFLYGENRWDPAADRTPPLGFVSAARRRARTVVTDDLFSSPTEVRSLAALLWSLEGSDGEDVLHAAGGPRVCRRDVLGATLEVWGLSPWPGIEVVPTDAEGRIPGQTLRRPRDSSLDSSRMRVLTGSSLPELRDGLEAVWRRVSASAATDA
jgi:dTDP-4-dehydrorhamnose reductase